MNGAKLKLLICLLCTVSIYAQTGKISKPSKITRKAAENSTPHQIDRARSADVSEPGNYHVRIFTLAKDHERRGTK